MKKFIFYLIIAILIGVMAFAGYNIYKIQKEYSDGEKTYAELEKLSPVEKSSDGKSKLPKKSTKLSENEKTVREKNFKELSSINKDFVGWIYIPNAGINYPMAHTDNDDYYLHHTLYHEYNKAGTIFLSSSNNPNFEDGNTIIFGHNLLNGIMFSGLMNYQYTDFFNANPYAYIYLKDRTNVYQAISAFVCTTSSPVYTTRFDKELLEKIRGWSMVSSSVKATEDDKFITLSTCTNWADEERFVVVMKKIK